MDRRESSMISQKKLTLGRFLKWQSTLVFLPGKFHGQRSLAGWANSPWGRKRVGHNLGTKQQWTKFSLTYFCQCCQYFYVIVVMLLIEHCIYGFFNVFLIKKVIVVQLLSRDPMNCSMPGFPVLHYLPGLAQTHVHWVGDTIQPSCLLLSPSPPAFNLSQHQGLF